MTAVPLLTLADRFRIAFYVDSVPFTQGVIAGTESLGGSESACVGLARALATMGHDVTIFTTKLAPDCHGIDQAGVAWRPAHEINTFNRFAEWDVFVALRMPNVFGAEIHARYRVLWNQDLLCDHAHRQAIMTFSWAFDTVAYVSPFHRWQWEQGLPELRDLGWVTRNGIDVSLVPDPKDVTRDPNRVIHISRPERGLRPLLEMWPAIRKANPQATLALCRYSSMYDAGGWGKVCAQYDALADAVHAEVGGIVRLGELGKAALYREIAQSAVMWYPGVYDFGETSCIAAIEAQACGTPFVGSDRGALKETCPSGVLIAGDASTPEYQEASVAAVRALLEGCAHDTVRYRTLQSLGRQHVFPAYAFETLAVEWTQQIVTYFNARYQGHPTRVLRQLLWEDDHVAARRLARARPATILPAQTDEWAAASNLCDYVIAGKDHTATDYSDNALDPSYEIEVSDRFKQVSSLLGAADPRPVSLLDIACGNGSASIRFLLDHPHLSVVGIDFAPDNIQAAQAAAEKFGVADRATFLCLPVWDFDRDSIHDAFVAWRDANTTVFDALFCGEFVEHVGDCQYLVDQLEEALAPGAFVVFTCPSGNCRELVPYTAVLQRGHVHRFAFDDVEAVWGGKADYGISLFYSGRTPRGRHFGNWVITYRHQQKPTGARPIDRRIVMTRPMATLSVGILAKDAEFDLGRCLESVWFAADEIIIGDTGSVDQTKTVAARFGDKVRVIDLPSVMDDPDGFAGARNRTLEAATGDWFLWIDTDERLFGQQALLKYLDSHVWSGIVIAQNHFHLDAPNTADKPVRLFRRILSSTDPLGRIRFYGCIHEQPQMDDCNADIKPTLEAHDLQIVHMGYLTEHIRRRKAIERNLPLLQRDAERFPARELGHVLRLRDCLNLAQTEAQSGDPRTANAKVRYYINQAVGIYERYLADPAHKYHELARPFYEMALRTVRAHTATPVYEMAITLGPTVDGQPPDQTVVLVRSLDQYTAEVQHRLTQAKAAVTPEPLIVAYPDAPSTPSPVMLTSQIEPLPPGDPREMETLDVDA